MNIIICKYTESDLPEMIHIWNEIVEEGIAFPQEDGRYEDICPYYKVL